MTFESQMLELNQAWILEKEPYSALKRSFKFKNFSQALEFLNKVGDIAEKQNHHPDISMGWGYLHIKYTTHDIGGLSQKDFLAAKTVDRLA